MTLRPFVPPASCLLATAALLLAALPGCSVFPGHKKDLQSVTLETNPGIIGKRGNAKGLTIELKASPDPLKLGESRQLDVTMVIRNNSKKTVALKFPTTQLIEILLRETDSGKVVSQWSTDQSFSALSRYLIINPKERLEYAQPITTRELRAGNSYNLEAYFVGYDQEARASLPIIPQR